jgi:Tol biopolymer transport system component/tRNA A-37 threonylcarbamoyl transferase component Bud32
MPDESRQRIGRYEIVGPLDAGGMGQVYRAWDPSLRREVAVKILRDEVAGDPARRHRLIEEARAAGALNHPNILAVYDVGVEQDVAFIVTELIEGKNLRDEIARGPLPVKRLLDLGVQMAAGLRAAHDAGIAHRDFKPANVMLTRDSRVKVVDFGLAKAFAPSTASASAHDAVTVTLPGTVSGTPQYMSPEQARGMDVDSRSDQFALGLTLYEMATGAHPFRRDSSPQTMAAIIADEARPIGELNGRVPIVLRWIIERCMAKDPADRYASTTDLLKDISNLQARLSELTTEDVRPVTKTGSRKWLALGLLAAVGAAVAAVVWGQTSAAPGARAFRPLVTDGSFQGAPAWSPDGKTLAYVAPVDGILQVFTRSEGSLPYQVTRQRFDASSPFWSPDGARIYFHSLAQSWESLWSISAAGGTADLVLQNALRAAISPDGRTLAFFREDEENADRTQFGFGTSIWLASPDGKDQRKYAEAPLAARTYVDSAIRFSPDSTKLLAWLWGWPDQSTGNVPKPEFWMLPMPSGTPHQVLPSLARASPVAASFDWFPDGRRIVVALWDEVTAGSHLWIADTESDTSVPLTQTPGSESRPVLTQDGRRVAFTSEAIDFDIVEIPLDGGSPRTLLASSRNEHDPTFAKDGNQYAYVSDKGGTLQLWLSSRNNEFERLIVGPDQFPGETTLALGSPALSPNGQQIAYQRYADKGGYQIWLSNTAGAGRPVLLVPGSFYQDAPSWSPNGEWIAYVERTKGAVAGLAKARVGAGGPSQMILPDVIIGSRPVWSPDGQWIVADTSAGLTIVRPDGKEPRLLSQENWLTFTWAADSRRLLGLRQADDRVRHYALAEIDVASGTERLLAPDLGAMPQALQGIRGLTIASDRTLATSIASARSDIWMVEGFDRPPSLLRRLFGR